MMGRVAVGSLASRSLMLAYTGHSHLCVFAHISDMCRDLVGILWNIE